MSDNVVSFFSNFFEILTIILEYQLETRRVPHCLTIANLFYLIIVNVITFFLTGCVIHFCNSCGTCPISQLHCLLSSRIINPHPNMPKKESNFQSPSKQYTRKRERERDTSQAERKQPDKAREMHIPRLSITEVGEGAHGARRVCLHGNPLKRILPLGRASAFPRELGSRTRE